MTAAFFHKDGSPFVLAGQSDPFVLALLTPVPLIQIPFVAEGRVYYLGFTLLTVAQGEAVYVVSVNGDRYARALPR